MKALNIKSPNGKIHFITAETLHHAINKAQQIDEYRYKPNEYKVIKHKKRFA